MTGERFDLLLRRASVATLTGDGYGAIENASLGIAGGAIAWLGRDADLPAGTPAPDHPTKVDLGDCTTMVNPSGNAKTSCHSKP